MLLINKAIQKRISDFFTSQYIFSSMQTSLLAKIDLAVPQPMVTDSNSYSLHLLRSIESEMSLDRTVMKIKRKEGSSKASRLLTQSYQIKPKMVSKLANWMEKIAKKTFNFSSETFEISIKILLKFLESQDVPPSQLQILGCVCLHLASKSNEKKIVCISNYIDCCLGIFNEGQFINLEETVFKELGFNLVQSKTFHEYIFFVIGKVFKITPNEDCEAKIENLIRELMKNVEFTQYSTFQICSNILLQMSLNDQEELGSERLLTLLQKSERAGRDPQ